MHGPPEELRRLLEDYFAFRGWSADGVPTAETLERLDPSRHPTG
jgi:aldehyde:ferredoxin oxidoreductase